MEAFETRLLASKNKGRMLAYAKRGSVHLLDFLLLFPKNTVLMAFLLEQDYILGKHQCLGRGSLSQLWLTESTLPTQGSAFEHTNGKDSLQKLIQLFAWFSRPLTNTPTR